MGKAGDFHGLRRTGFQGGIFGSFQFVVAVAVEFVDRHHHRQPKRPDDADVVGQVGAACDHRLEVGLVQLPAGRTAVPSQGAYRSDQDHGAGQQAALPRFDVHEFLEPKVRPEAGFRYHVVGEGQRQLVGDHGAASVGDVAEGAGVDEGGLTFQGLHHVGDDGLTQQCHQGAGDAQHLHGNRRSAPGGADNDPGYAGPQVFQSGGQSQDGHDLRRRYEVEPGLSQRAVTAATQSGDHLTQRPVRRVGNPGPFDAGGVHVRRLVSIDRVVHQGGQQVVSRGDGVGVSGKVDVDLIFRHHPGFAAAGAAALDPEYRPQ